MTTAIGSPDPAQGQLVFAWGGVVVFALSASYFLFSLFVTFAHPLPDGPRLGPALTNLLAYAAFALHHSLFAREGVRAWVRHTVAPGAERAVYVWTASLLLALLCRVWVDVPGLLWDVPGHARWAFRAVQVGGAGVLLVIGVLPTMTLTQATFAAASAAYVLAAIPFEERSLRRSAPAAYDRYAQQVRWRLLPLIY
jgi:protein-S-isoprenylcysteine O-methyltransferase Ste14